VRKLSKTHNTLLAEYYGGTKTIKAKPVFDEIYFGFFRYNLKMNNHIGDLTFSQNINTFGFIFDMIFMTFRAFIFVLFIYILNYQLFLKIIF